MTNFGNKMYAWMKFLFPLCRSLTGTGVDKTLSYLKNQINIKFKILKFKTGQKVFDWRIPEVWNIKDGYIKNMSGKKLVDFKNNNLHVVGYSTPINKIIQKNELLKHIYTQPNQPEWIPYVTSYYKKNWGFCVSEKFKKKFKDEKYKVYIDSTHKRGDLKIAETIIKGKKNKEIFFSTYFCHPSMANDNLSSIIVQSALIKYINLNYKKTNFTYRFIFIPETIGSIAYLSTNLKKLKKSMIAGFNLSCVGDDRCYSHVESRESNNLADQALTAALLGKKNIKKYSFLYRGSDERQYCAPGVDLPVCGFSRSKFGEYKEYHTSADNLSIISAKSLQNSLDVLISIVDAFETELKPLTTIKGEPQLSKYNLYPSISQKGIVKKGIFNKQEFINRCNLIAYADGKRNIFEISKKINIPLQELIKEIKILKKNKILR
jgi:aminopeptidase-like protein